jgi:hypothetical protein
VRFLQSRRRVNASAGSLNRGRDLALRQSIRHIMPIVASPTENDLLPASFKGHLQLGSHLRRTAPARARPGDARDAASGLTDVRRLGDMLARVRGRITLRDLDGVSPRPSALVARFEPLLIPLKAIILSD